MEEYGAARQGADDSMLWRVCLVRSLDKATDTEPECVILHVSARLVRLREHTCLLRVYVHCLSLK